MPNESFYITTPIFYANARPHIGHTYTAVLTDVMARYQRLLGKTVLFATGMDEHGANIARKAHEAKKQPKTFVNEQAALFKAAWQTLNISYDDFIRTTEARHEEAVAYFLKRLKASDTVYEGTYEGLYCTGCEAFKDHSELSEGKCPLHNRAPEKVKEKNWFFKLSAFRDELARRITADEIRIIPESKKREMLSFLSRGLNDISISRENQPWGIPIPFDPTQTVYVWVDALINYLTVVGYPNNKEKLARFWPATWHVLGKDISRFHCIIWPALLLAVGIEPPRGLFVHGFLTVDGQKMSKTLGNVVAPETLVEKFGVDGARYVLLRQMVPGEDSDVALEKLTAIYTAELKNGLGNLLSRTLTLAQRARLEKLAPVAHPEAERLTAASWQAYHAALAEFNFSAALGATAQLVSWANRFVDSAKPWTIKNDVQLNRTLFPVAEVIRHCILQLLPFIPRAAALAAGHLGLKLTAVLLPNQLAGLQQWAASPLTIGSESVHLFS